MSILHGMLDCAKYYKRTIKPGVGWGYAYVRQGWMWFWLGVYKKDLTQKVTTE